MAPTFGRSISFPLSPASASARSSSSKPRHIRSISLPCRSHPLLAHLHAHTAAARAWAAAANPTPTTATASSGLALIHALHAAIADLLLLPEPQHAVRRAAASDRLLDAFLLLADAHRGFHEALLALRSHAADASAALRRRDAARLAAAARAQRRTEKDLACLAAAAVAATKCCPAARLGFAATAEETTEMAAALMDAAAASAAASAAVFSAAASMSAAVFSSSKKAAVFAKKNEAAADVAPEKLEELERCIDECESGSEVVFRSIVRTRVSLLNIRTPAI